MSSNFHMKLPKAKEDKNKWKKGDPATTPTPIPQYEREDKCTDSCKKTPAEKEIKKDIYDTAEKLKEKINVPAPVGSGHSDKKNWHNVAGMKNWRVGKGPQTQDQQHPRLDLSPSKEKSRRSRRVFDGTGMPKDIRRLGKATSNFLLKGEKWQNFVSEEDKKKIPEKILNDKDYEGRQLKKECSPCAGQKVEMEHKDTLIKLGVPEDKLMEAAKMIASDHIKEDPEYYKHLKEMEEKFAKAQDNPTNTPQMKEIESEIRQLRLKSKLSPGKEDLKEVQEVHKDVSKEWMLNLTEMLKSDRVFSGTFHKPVIDKENDIIPASAMDRAMDDFMILPTLQEVHTERTVGIITKAWKTGDDEYKFEGVIKPGDDCDDVWQKIKKGEYDGLSIGGRRTKYSKECAIPSLIRDTPCVTHRLKLYNVSVCSSPVNPEATVDDVNKVAKAEV